MTEWTLTAPDGTKFTGATAYEAARRGHRHGVEVDPVKAKELADLIERSRQASEEENERLLGEHGTLNCPACGGSGHVGDAERIALMDRWLPIETAPETGEVLVFGEWAGEINGIDTKPRMGVATRCTGRTDYPGFNWKDVNSDAYAVWWKPTHWQPKPVDPQDRK